MKKNIFFLFPPGYSGSYLRWIFNISENSKKESTIKNPLLPNGTAHGFARNPTHTGSLNILNWIIKNQPTTPQTYVVYGCTDAKSWDPHPANVAYRFLKSYPDALFVNIHAKTQDEVKVAALNGYTKWTTWIYDQAAFNPNVSYNFDWEGGKNNLISLPDRNWLLENWKNVWPSNDQPFNWEELKYNIDCFKKWYNVRKQREPDETNDEQFNNFDNFNSNQIFDITLKEIYNVNFFENSQLFRWIESQNAGQFDWNQAKQYHQTYIDAQANIRWFDDIKKFRQQKQVSKWLLQNSFSQALLLEEISTQLDHATNWELQSTEEILTTFNYTLL
jgi:hypothetical protein